MPEACSLRAVAWARAAHCLQVDQWTAEVVAEFRRRGIRCILLKGPVVARWLYAEDPGRRVYVDMDLMVAPHQLGQAEEALRAIGFISQEPLRPRHGLRAHADAWQRGRDGAVVDLHVALHGTERVAGEKVWESVGEDTEWWEVAGTAVEVPGVVARTLHAILNLHPHDLPSSQGAEDLGRAIQRVPPDVWSCAAGLADRLGVSAQMGTKLRSTPTGISLAERLGLPDLGLPDEERERLFLIRSNASAPVISLAHLGSLPTAMSKVQYALDIFLPPATFLRSRWGFARRGTAGLTVGYAAWTVSCLARALWAVTRFLSLRGEWSGDPRLVGRRAPTAGGASLPHREGSPDRRR